MHTSRHDIAADLFDLHARFAADRARGGLRAVEDYTALFPGLEDEVRTAYAAITSAGELDTDESPIGKPERRVGRYRLLRELGRGGQGAVHLAEDTQLGRKVALKMLTGVAQFSSDARRRFQREAETASRLDHPAICTVYESGFEGELAFIAMRFVEGETLSRRLARARDGSLPSAERAPCAPGDRTELAATLRFFEEAARALHAAHEAGVIHRDVKPANLMVSASGGPVILDFGLARALESTGESITNTGDQVGTPSYMSPEQIDAQGRALDRRTDVYSLGATLYECLTLEAPFQKPTLASLYHAILREPPRDPRSWTRSIPRELVVVLETALEKDRDRRYTTALDFAEDLRRVRELHPIRARPASLGLRVVRWVQRHPARAITVGAFLVIAALGVVTRVIAADLAAKEQMDDDRKIEGRLLDLLAETPMRGEWHDWALECRNYLRVYADYGLELAAVDAEARFRAAWSEARTRSASGGEALAEELLDGLYRVAWTIDEARRPRAQDSRKPPPDLDVDAALGAEWEPLHARLLRIVDALETSSWKRRAWSAHRAFVGNRTDGYDELIAEARGAGCSSSDRIRLSELVYLARKDGTAVELLDLAEQGSDLSPAQRFVLRLERGVLLLNQGDVRRAQIDLDVARELRPTCAAACICLSNTWWKLGDVDKALAFARTAVELDPRNPNAQNRLAAVAVLLRSPDVAESAALEARRLVPSDPTPLRILGDIALLRDDELAAVEAWADAAEIESDPRALWSHAGAAVRRVRGSAASASFIRGLGLSTRESAWMLAACAQSARAQRDERAELELLEAAHADAPEDAGIAGALGRALFEAREPARAVEVLRAALAQAPGTADLAVTLGRALLSVGERETAVRTLSDALSATSDARSADALALALADACFGVGDLERAEELARRCVDAQPDALDRRRFLASICEVRGELEEAVEQQFEVLERAPGDSAAFEQAARLVATGGVSMDARIEEMCTQHPTSVAFAVLHALVLQRHGDLDAALKLLERAATLDPMSVYAPLWASDLCIVAGRMRAAIEHARLACLRQPHSVPARVLLARALRGAGEYTEALRVGDDALVSLADDQNLFAEWVRSAFVLGLHRVVIQRCDGIVARDPKRMDGWMQRVRAFRFMGELGAAEAQLRRLLDQHPNDRNLLGELADVLFEALRWEDAVRAYEARGRAEGLAPTEVAARYRRYSIAQQRALAAAAESTDEGRARLDGRTAFELGGLGRFSRAATAFAGEAPPADFRTPDAGRWVAVCSECCARAALEAWNSEHSTTAPVEDAEWAAALATPQPKSKGAASEFAARALGLLEARLDRRERTLESESAPTRRAALADELEAELFDPGLLAVRVPPESAPWAERARTYTWRVRALLASARRTNQ